MSNNVNIGQHFGEWEVIEFSHKDEWGKRYWLCECSCGKRKAVLGRALITDKSMSCGHTRICNYIGKVYGDWEVIERIDSVFIKCRCTSCGYEREFRRGNLMSDFTPRCKCHNSDEDNRRVKLEGKEFGYWKVKEFIGDGYYKCECKCGEIRNIKGTELTRNRSTSCGCRQKYIFEGMTCGNRTIIKKLGNRKLLVRCNICNREYETGYGFIYDGSKSCGCEKIENQRKTMFDRYGDTSQSRIGNTRSEYQIRALEDRESLIDFIVDTFGEKVPTTRELADELDLSEVQTLVYIRKYKLYNLVNRGLNRSRYEDEISEYIKSIDNSISINKNDRELLGGREIDIYLPDKKLAIEIDGVYWHSSIFKDKNYHQNKSADCARLGIQVIHIFEYELLNEISKKKVMDYIADRLNLKPKQNIYARNTEVRHIDKKESGEFLNKYHLQGDTHSSIGLGCYYKEQLVGVMTFGKPRFNGEYEYELIRLCWRSDVKVIGGSEKIISTFINIYNPKSIISYCNLAKFSGRIYSKMGFRFDGITKPNYVWVNLRNNTVLSRYQTIKSRLVELGLGDESQTEDEIMLSNGNYKVYDCGNSRYVWINNSK